MNARVKCTDVPIGEPKVIRDMLPSPDQLAFRDEDVKITITLNTRGVDFFKDQAAKSETQYQRMICRLLDAYVETHASALTGPRRSARKQPDI